MKRLINFTLGLACAAMISSVAPNFAWAQAGGHASVGLKRGEEGFLYLEEMIKHLEFSSNLADAGSPLKTHGGMALKHAREALKHYEEALRHVSESLGLPPERPMREGSGGQGGQQTGQQR